MTVFSNRADANDRLRGSSTIVVVSGESVDLVGLLKRGSDLFAMGDAFGYLSPWLVYVSFWSEKLTQNITYLPYLLDSLLNLNLSQCSSA